MRSGVTLFLNGLCRALVVWLLRDVSSTQ